MTSKEFLRIFTRLAKGTTWTIGRKLGVLREKGTKCCPLSFVGRKLTGRQYKPDSFYGPAKAIGLSPRTAARIADGADVSITERPNRLGWGTTEYTPIWRTRLLKAVGKAK